jgi:hypothetical protein
MSSVVWSLEYDGERRPLRQWGLENAVLTLGNQVQDTLRLVVAGETITEAPAFEFERKVVLFRDQVRWFTGWITSLPTSESAGGTRREYVASGPWYFLENIIFQQIVYRIVDPQSPLLGLIRSRGPRVILMQDDDGSRTTTGTMIGKVVAYALERLAVSFGSELPFAVESYAALAAEVPYETVQDLPCAEVIRRCLRWYRDAAVSWDYVPTIPVLKIKRRGEMVPAVIDLDERDRVASYNLTPRPDLVPRGVRFLFEYTSTNTTTGAQFNTVVEQSAGIADDGHRVPVMTLRLSGSGDATEPVPAGLAALYFSSVSTMHWEGSIDLRETDPTGLLAVGNVLNLQGGDPAWETMAALIQSVTIDIGGRSTQASFGPAEQLGPQDFFDLVRVQTGFGGSGGSGTGAGSGPSDRFEGTPPDNSRPPPPKNPPSPPPPGTPPPQDSQRGHFIEICEAGQKKEIFVRG